jgi:hypothetical protein
MLHPCENLRSQAAGLCTAFSSLLSHSTVSYAAREDEIKTGNAKWIRFGNARRSRTQSLTCERADHVTYLGRFSRLYGVEWR